MCRYQLGDCARASAHNMAKLTELGLCVEDVAITGHAQPIILRSYRPSHSGSALPLIIYFHGGSFTGGTLDDGDVAAKAIARGTPAWVVSVGYSLAPEYPFPHAPEDGWRALLWAWTCARDQRADPRRIGIAGHDAGGNLATSVAAMARDRHTAHISAQALLAPLLDPSMTRLADDLEGDAHFDLGTCASCYRAYLPTAMQRLHPYAAPLESRRLVGLPPALIASVHGDKLHVEAERYASELIAAGVHTEVVRYRDTTRKDLSGYPAALEDVVDFFQKRLSRRHSRRVG
jgi:acetyl esterase